MTIWETTTEAEQLANVRKWMAYYKKDRDEANEEIERLKASNAELLAACRAAYELLANIIEDVPIYWEGGDNLLIQLSSAVANEEARYET